MAPFTIEQASSADLREAARTRIQAAIDQFETGDAISPSTAALQPEALDASALLLSGKYEEVLSLFNSTTNASEELRTAAATALNSQGMALAARARATLGVEADELWEEAGKKYEEALRIEPNRSDALNNLGNVLSARARTRDAPEADRLRKAADEKYAEAVRLKPDNHEALNNWGIALDNWATTKRGSEADELGKAAGAKYEEALRIKPDKHAALFNWGVALLRRAAAAVADERAILIDTAIAKCESANTIDPGTASYNLACAYALRGDAESCRKWLLDSKAHGVLPSREHMLKDADLDAVRDLPWFTELLNVPQ